MKKLSWECYKVTQFTVVNVLPSRKLGFKKQNNFFCLKRIILWEEFFKVKKKIIPLRCSKNFLATLFPQNWKDDTLFLNYSVAKFPSLMIRQLKSLFFTSDLEESRNAIRNEGDSVTENFAATLTKPFYHS